MTFTGCLISSSFIPQSLIISFLNTIEAISIPYITDYHLCKYLKNYYVLSNLFTEKDTVVLTHDISLLKRDEVLTFWIHETGSIATPTQKKPLWSRSFCDSLVLELLSTGMTTCANWSSQPALPGWPAKGSWWLISVQRFFLFF